MKLRQLSVMVKKNPVFLRSGILAAASVVCFACIYIWDNSRALMTNESGQAVLKRGEAGDDRVQELEADIGGIEENLEVEISGKAYGEEELDEVFQQAQEALPLLISGDNGDLSEVREPLDLITEIPDTGISVSWETDPHDVISADGTIREENLTEEGAVVKLTAALKYGSRVQYCELYAHVFPPAISPSEKLIRELEEKTVESDEATKTEEYMILPGEIGGETVRWSFPADRRAYAVLILGIGISCMLAVSDRQRKKEEEKRTARQMQIDYPQIINKFNLYIRAGMTVRKAWFLIVQDYERRNGSRKKRKAYEEMAAAMYQIRGGLPEGECYENYGARCKEQSYRKFGMMLSQNLRKGSGGLTDLLEREAEEAFEDRRKLAKKLGEEAGTKLMIPLFLMLIIVFAVMIVPAFFSIQI